MTIKIGQLSIQDPVVLAPMSGVTDMPFRRLVKRYGADNVGLLTGDNALFGVLRAGGRAVRAAVDDIDRQRRARGQADLAQHNGASPRDDVRAHRLRDGRVVDADGRRARRHRRPRRAGRRSQQRCARKQAGRHGENAKASAPPHSRVAFALSAKTARHLICAARCHARH